MTSDKVAAPLDKALERALHKELAARTDAMVTGAPTDFPSYQYLRGQIDGIQFAISALIELRDRLNFDGDKDF